MACLDSWPVSKATRGMGTGLLGIASPVDEGRKGPKYLMESGMGRRTHMYRFRDAPPSCSDHESEDGGDERQAE